MGLKTTIISVHKFGLGKKTGFIKSKETLTQQYAILPFEQKYFKEKHDYPVSFVGNPLFDTIIKRKKSTTFYSKKKSVIQKDLS